MSSSSSAAAPVLDIPTHREYEIARSLKYGCNPHQLPAAILSIKGQPLPFTVLNGTPGYINLLDAVNAWQLVRELRTALNLPAAASFKHVSPAGAAVATPIDSNLSSVYEIASGETLTPSAIAYMRARQADPKCSFGDFAALSDTVDVQTAEFLKKEVSDGIIAPDYEEKALEILKTKKGGGYIILKANIDYKPPAIEYREIAGVVFAQRRNDIQLTKDHLQKVVTKNKSLSEDAIRDLLVASITAKYTQSNTVVYAVDGQAIGVGAGQQSRVDCVKLAGGKAEIWWLRQHPKVKELKFKDNIKRVERTNARIAYIEGGMTKEESKVFNELFLSPPEPITLAEKESWIAQLKGVSVCSDAFFPFRDNIDQASKRGVHYISQPGGSVQDEQVIAAADEYGMVMAFTNVRLFHH